MLPPEEANPIWRRRTFASRCGLRPLFASRLLLLLLVAIASAFAFAFCHARKRGLAAAGPRGALTGPASRGDQTVVEGQLDAMDPATADLYRTLVARMRALSER